MKTTVTAALLLSLSTSVGGLTRAQCISRARWCSWRGNSAGVDYEYSNRCQCSMISREYTSSRCINTRGGGRIASLIQSVGRKLSSVKKALFSRSLSIVLSTTLIYITTSLAFTARRTLATVISPKAGGAHQPVSPGQGLLLWAALFLFSAMLHSAESAITRLSSWKIREFAEEEGPQSPFATLSDNITRLLSTILIASTTCSIYSTAMFVTAFSALLPDLGLEFVTMALTLITLFFGELLPKALAVGNSEYVARLLVPPISKLSVPLLPFTSLLSLLSDSVLRRMGLRSYEDRNVSEDMVRRVVAEAQRTEGIASAEGRMIRAVLDLEDRDVKGVMTPRVDMASVPTSAPASEILRLATETRSDDPLQIYAASPQDIIRYSRIPVYRDSVDDIVGIVFSKDLLLSIKTPPHAPVYGAGAAEELPIIDQRHLLSVYYERSIMMMRSWKTLTAEQLMEPTFYMPETTSAWQALQEMKKRRVHMAIVVDEYGGTAGAGELSIWTWRIPYDLFDSTCQVTFEDILEEVVGEIYDEDDADELKDAARSITILREAGYESSSNYVIKGVAKLDEVGEALGLQLSEEVLNEYSTFGGYLCMLAGAIPAAGDEVSLSPDYRCIVTEVDARRILSVRVERKEGTHGASNMVNSSQYPSNLSSSVGYNNGGGKEGLDANGDSGSTPWSTGVVGAGGALYFSEGQWVYANSDNASDEIGLV